MIQPLIEYFLVFTGYFCPPGQNISNPYPCGQGYYCEIGSANETACISGYYQDEEGQSECKQCSSGNMLKYYTNIN